MRIVSPCCGIAPGATSGGEVLERETLMALARLGHQSHILLARGKAFPRGLANFIEPTWPSRGQHWTVQALVLPSYLRRCWRRHGPPDIYRAHAILGVGHACLWAGRGHRRPVVIHHTHFDPGDRWRRLKIDFLRRADRVVTISEFSLRQLEQAGIEPVRISVIPCGVGPEFYQPSYQRAGEAPLVLFLGELKARKNVGFLLNAWRYVREQVPGAQLWIVGDGPLRARLQAYSNPSIRWLGRISDVARPSLYRLADVFAFPSLLEGFGLPVLEAMACGLPIVSSGRGALAERYEHGKGGFHSDPDEGPERFGRLLVDLLRAPGLRRWMGDQNVAAAKAFSWDQSARQLAAAMEAMR